mmetsp:Transcript_12009/g.25035  ORF Transcript_12009/g.25035 Transcript_12009/m.25035 type:complete len:444 (+) Transcript_12009:1274-2605(+)
MDEQFGFALVGREGISHDHSDQRGLTGAVGAQDHDAGRQRHLETNARQGVLVVAGITEIDVVHLQKFLRGGTDPLESSRIGEGEFEFGGGEFEVMLRLRLFLDEFGHLAGVVNELAVRAPGVALLVVYDVGADVLQEGGVVRHDEDGGVLEAAQVLNEPVNRLEVQVIRGLIKKEDVGVDQNRLGQAQFHLPSARQFPDGPVPHHIREFQSVQHRLAVLLAPAALLHQILEHVPRLVHRIDVRTRIDVMSPKVRRPTLQLAVVDRRHQRRLAHAVLTDQGVDVPPPQSQLRLMEQDLPTVRQGEADVRQFLAAERVLLVLGFVAVSHGGPLARLAEFFDGLLALLDGSVVGSEAGEGGQVRCQRFRPNRGIEVALGRQGRGQGRDVAEDLDGVLVAVRSALGQAQLLHGVIETRIVGGGEGLAEEFQGRFGRVEGYHHGDFSF